MTCRGQYVRKLIGGYLAGFYLAVFCPYSVKMGKQKPGK